MQKKKWIRYVESFILMPVMAMSGSVANLPTATATPVTAPVVVSSQKLNMQAYGTLALNQALAPKPDEKDITEDAAAEAKAKILQSKADAIDSYFKDHDMPLKGSGMKMVLEAEKNDLDWRLVAAISVRESTGGRQDCIKVANNPFGWGSCKIGFKSNDEAIETISRNLGGNNPKTSVRYADKTTLEILHTYNPPSIVPKYAEQVISIMNTIGDANLGAKIEA